MFVVLCLSPFFFFTMRARPPISTLFPYTTLFRSSGRDVDGVQRPDEPRSVRRVWDGDLRRNGSRCGGGRGCFARSEEHTSVLQSPCNLVCRLLLEKKN